MRRAVVCAALVALTAGCHAIAGRVALPPATPVHIGGTAHTTAAATIPAVSPTPTPAPTSTPASSRPSVGSLVDRRIAAAAAGLPSGAISVAALNTATGAAYHWGATGGMWTGSVYKLLVLQTLLLQRQRTRGWFGEDELEDITAMMENSDNKAGYRMYLAAGGGAALASAAHRLGLRHTRIGVSDPTFTTMGADDGIALLRALVDDRPLAAPSRDFTLGLMRSVEADQRWGVGVVADRGSRFANKNGWLHVDDDNGPGEQDAGRWLVDSLGIVRMHGQRVLMAIFTKHNPDCYTGIDLVEHLARLMRPAITA